MPINSLHSFMQNPNREPDTTCLQDLSRIDFITSDTDVMPTKFVYWVNGAILQGGSPLLVAVIALCFAIFLIQILVFVGKFKVYKSSILPFLAALISFLNFAATIGFYRLLITNDVTLLGFGLPISASPLIDLWFTTGIIAVFMLVLQLVKQHWNLLSTLVIVSSLTLQVLIILMK